MPAISGSQRFVTQSRFGVARFGATRFGAYRAVIRAYYREVIGNTLETLNIDKSTLTINLTEDDRPSTCSFDVPVRDASDAALAIGSDVLIMQGDTHSTSAVLYRGRIRSIRHTSRPRTHDRGVKHVECSDARTDLDRKLIRARFTSTDVRTITASLLSSLAAVTTPAWTTDAVGDCGTIDEIEFTNETLLTAMQRIAVRSGARWYTTGSSSPTATMRLHMNVSSEATRYAGAPAHPVANLESHYWDLEVEHDLSQTRTRVYVEGDGVVPLAQIPVGARAMPTEGIPDWYQSARSAGVTNSLTEMRSGLQLLTAPLYTFPDEDNGRIVTSVTAAVAPNANTITVATNADNMLNPPNWVKINDNWIYHRTFGFPSWITGIPTSGPGSITASIAAGAAVAQYPNLQWTNSITYQIEAGDHVNIWIKRNDVDAQTAIAALEPPGSDGVIEHVATDGRLGVQGAYERADALLALYKSPEYRGSYTTRDPNAAPGKSIMLNVTSPTQVSSQTVRIVDVSISDPEDSYSGYTFPQRRVVFTSQRYRDIYQIVRKLDDPGD